MPRIYVASLADYNAGRLHGRWIETGFGEECIRDDIQAMLAESAEPGAEEYAIHDFEGFGPVEIDEYDSIAFIAALTEVLEDVGNGFGYYFNVMGVDRTAAAVEDARSDFDDAYIGLYNSVRDYAEQYLEDTGALESMPEELRAYFDYDAYARDLELGGDIWAVLEPGRGYHLFHNN